jgi:hypothetical protein
MKITMTPAVYETIRGDLDAISRDMTDLYMACCSGDLKKVAAHIQSHVSKTVDCIKDTLTDCVLDNSETLAEVNFRRGFDK